MRWLDYITDSMDKSLSKLGDGEGQGSLACCSPWGHKELDTTEQLNNNSFRTFILGRKAMTNLDSILKIRDITLPTKVYLVKLTFFQ